MSVTAPFLSVAAPLPKLMSFQSYLFIGPHPDDIEVGCAPTVKRLTQAGKKVSFLIITDGRMGSVNGLSGNELILTRQAEAKKSAALLGVDDISFLTFHDGGLYKVEDVAAEIAREIVKTHSDVVFAPDADVRSECHLDHIKVGQAAKYAMNMAPFAPIMEGFGLSESYAPKALALYFTSAPNAFIRVSKQYGFRKAALECFTSQFRPDELKAILSYFMLRSTRMGLHCFAAKADGYRAFAPVHMHCCPEHSEIYSRSE